MQWLSSVRKFTGGPAFLIFIPTTYLFAKQFFEAPNSIIPTSIAIFFLGWLLRGGLDPTRNQDLSLFTLFLTWKLYKSVQSDWTHLTSFWPISLPVLIAAALLAFGGAGLALQSLVFDEKNKVRSNDENFFPLILPSRTTHTRFFPKRHSFSYSYLQVSIPVGFEGCCGSLLSVGEIPKKGWFHIQASDYLERTSEKLSLKAKLSAYLQSQAVKDEEWDYAFLITAPRFLGYSFNPVSFWYIYTKEGKLSMMILEVNNTFDERRMYLLKYDGTDSYDDDIEKPPKDVPERFKNVWPKDFHVSPFSSRKGHYSLSAVDPFGHLSPKSIVFDNTIVLKSSKDHAKLVARVFSDGAAIDPQTTSALRTFQILLSWCWVGFLTAPRILKEAFVLYFQRSLHVWLRPEVLPSSIGRRATAIEKSLEPFFGRYLEDLVKRSAVNLEVVYKSGLDTSATRTFCSRSGDQTREAERLEIRVLSPVFFSRFVHYAHTDEAFDRECIFTDEKNRTISVSRPELLPQLFSADKYSHQQAHVGMLDWIRWSFHQRLRCPPATPTYLFPQPGGDIQDIRNFASSPLDRFVQSSDVDVSLYRRLCTRLFLAQRFAFGLIGIIDLLDLLLRASFIWIAISAITNTSLEHTIQYWRPNASAFSALSSMASSHIWAYLKGVS